MARSAKIIHGEAAAFDNTFECADRNRFVPVHGYNHLPPIGVTPFLMAAFLTDLDEAVFSQDSDNFPSIANWEAFAHVRATSNTFAPAESSTGDGSNQRSKASLAFSTASSSVSPAEAHPGNSGKNAAQRFDSESYSTTRRTFMWPNIIRARLARNCGIGELQLVPVVGLTGEMNPTKLSQAFELGINALHEKPARFEDSVALVSVLYTHWNAALRPKASGK